MIGTVHVYDTATGKLAALGLTSEPHVLRVCDLIQTHGTVVLAPCELIAEVHLYQELEFHEGKQMFPSPRWN